MMTYLEKTIKRFHNSYITEPNTGCWLWLLTADKDGYGKVCYQGKTIRAHRLSHVLFKGKIPCGLLVLHRCHTPGCVNPDHLYSGDQYDNERDKLNAGRHKCAQKTHCPKGHEYTKENTIHSNQGGFNHRNCKQCAYPRTRAWYWKNRDRVLKQKKVYNAKRDRRKKKE